MEHCSCKKTKKLKKKCLSDAVAILCTKNENLKGSVNDIQLSWPTVEEKISDINNSVETHLYSDLEKCQYFTIVLDES